MKITKHGAARSFLRSLLATAVATVTLAAPLAGAKEQAEGYDLNPQTQSFIDALVKEENFDRKELQAWFAQAQKQQSILDAIARPAEKTKTWAEYQDIFLTSSRVEKGLEFWSANRETLQRAEQKFGVPAQIIVAIIGVETRYGAHKGGYRVMDALSTLAFDYPPRSTFFTKELRQFLLLAREQQRDPLTLKGSYAGAMGYGQFMPSSYRAYATDFDGDGFVDIWENPEDAIGSVANYFVRHGWKSGESVVHRARVSSQYDAAVVNDSLKPLHTVGKLKAKGFTPVDTLPADASASAIQLEGKQGTEYWIGLQNFYAITRYNHSRLYAMAVYQLSEQLRSAMEAQTQAKK